MRDTRCCNVVLRVFRSIVPDFGRQGASPSPIQEFISSDVLKACIISFHEPYFVEVQRELAQLIATILIYYCPHSDTPKKVLQSLPGIQEKSVDRCINHLARPGVGFRQQAAFVMELLWKLRGVSISEQGRVTKRAGTVRKEMSKMQKEFMKVGIESGRKKQATPEMDGVAGMFDTQFL